MPLKQPADKRSSSLHSKIQCHSAWLFNNNRQDVICSSARVEFWRLKGILERTRPFDYFAYPIRLLFRIYLCYRANSLVILKKFLDEISRTT